MNILVTGANGYIGSAICDYLESNTSYNLIKLSRSATSTNGFIQSPELSKDSDWTHLLNNVDVVIHLAARAHILNDIAEEPLVEYNRVNFEGTVKLAQQAISHGVKRFIFFSSIGVIGSVAGKEVLNENTPLCPNMDYAISKAKAEIELQKLFSNADSELIIIRPTLVYSGYAPGNFHTLLEAVFKGIPLPLGAINNQRMLLSVKNLVSFISVCLKFKGDGSGVYILSDDQKVSINHILECIALGMGKRSKLLKIPYPILAFLCSLIGKKDKLDKICGNFVVDCSKAKKVFNWKPVIDTTTALKLAGQEYLAKRNNIKL